MKKEFYTVAEFAELCGVSKQAVYKRLNNSLKEFTRVENGQKVIAAAAFPLFKGQEVKQPNNQQVDDVEQQGLIPFFQKQIEEKDRLIESLHNDLSIANKRIADMSMELAELMKQSQELTRNTQVLLLKETEVKALPKKSIFSKIFKKKESEE